ncbi:MAG: hypothetical protein ABIS86_17035 [Streptosporangiaceae bacterium]
MTGKAKAIEAVVAEAGKRDQSVTFGEGEGSLTVEIPRKVQTFKFVRAMGRNDIGTALSAIWKPSPVLNAQGEHQRDPLGALLYDDHPTVLALDELDLTSAQFNDAIEKIGMAIGGAPEKSEASSSS